MARQDKNSAEPVIKLRRLVKLGNSLYVCIPREFIALHDLKKGEKVPVLANHIMKVVPMKEA